MRNCKTPKSICFIHKSFFKHFNEQAFLHNIYNSDLNVISSMLDVNLAWNCFKTNYFLSICDKHAQFKQFSISVKNNPWFNYTISTFIGQRNAAWAKAKKSNDSLDWIS